MDKIYTITVMSLLEKDELGWPHFGDTRVVGWLPKFADAYECVVTNYGDIWETCYDYAIIETVEAGLYSYGKPRWFFKFDEEKKQYIEIPEPDWMEQFVNIGIG